MVWDTVSRAHARLWTSLINIVCVLAAPCTGFFPISLPLLGLPYSLRHNSIEIRTVNNPTIDFKHSSERKSHTLLTLSQKLQRTKLSEEGMLKAKTD